jgi:membrane-associated phospholipid phosphatase
VLGAIDAALLRLLQTHGHAPQVERAVIVFTRLGEHGAIWFLIAAAGRRMSDTHRPVYRRATRAVAATLIANSAVKLAIRRVRPALEDLPPIVATMSSLSYPSAHASSSFAGARVLREALPPELVYTLALSMALTRPYLGVHWPSDTLAGALLGTAVAELTP